MRHSIPALMITASLSMGILEAQPRRPVESSRTPLAQARFDRGPADPDTHMSDMTILLHRTPEQQAALDQLLADQQNPKSPRYRQWLTPEQFAERFGASQADVDKVTEWLQSAGFAVTQLARGRDYISFEGSAGQVEAALRARIRRYELNGRSHYANATEPALPSHIAGLVAGIRGLDDFHPKPHHRVTPGAAPQVSLRGFPNLNLLVPDDLATIYNVSPLYQAGIDGSGQTIAVVGQSDIDLADIRNFRTVFGLPANDPRKILVPGNRNPGRNDAELEADLDLEWAGAIARQATILYVFGQDAFSAAAFATDQALAPVVSISFGLCEANASPALASALRREAQKASALGITWLAASGDSGAADCENQGGDASAATTPLSVDLPASVPEVTAVGGTEFNEGSGSFFSSRLGPNFGSALSYIPEVTWNDEALITRSGGSGFAASGGGASIFFEKPSWQTGLGVPADGVRSVPDIALTASGAHDPYVVLTQGRFVPVGGTSAAAPSFAGMIALLNQSFVSTGVISQAGLGNINPMLYSLAQTAPSAFHDITTGSNIVPCVNGSSPDCAGGSMGFTAGTGYDQVTGLGSVDAAALALAWQAQLSTAARLAITQFTAGTTVRTGGPLSLSWTVANQGGTDSGAFQTRVYFTTNGQLSTALSNFISCDVDGLSAGASATCSGTVNLDARVTPGTYQLLAVAGNSTALASTGPLQVTK